MQVVTRPISELSPYEKNSRTHSPGQIAQIARSLQEFGWTNPLLIDETGRIVAGHGRLAAAVSLGMEAVPTITLAGLTDAQIRAYVIADNKLAENAGWDLELLRLEVAELKDFGFDLQLLGYEEKELTELLEFVPPNGGLTDPDEVPEVPEEPVTKLGDVWLLGRHRLMCGDSTSGEAVGFLMAGVLADLVVTDPPYGVSYADKNKSLNAVGKGTRIQTKILNDHLKGDDLSGFFLAAFSSLFCAMKEGAPFYVFAPQGGEQMMMMMMMKESGLPVRHELIWVKNNHALGRADYHYKHEPVLYGWKDGAGHPWFGDRNKFSTWHIDKPVSSKLHPTMKPVDLLLIPLNNSSLPGAIVLDLFGGSGSTLIACEKTGRVCYCMELSPHYCDVIVKRWEQFTGQVAVLEEHLGS
jgi:DNA modification methylase